jgi:hypothetical protein
MLTMKRALLALGLTIAIVPEARAQMTWTDKIFVNGSGGYQFGSRDVDSTSSFEVYEEPASLTGLQTLESEFIFDVSAGYRIRPNLALGLGYANYNNEGTVAVTARIPHPLITDTFRTATIQAAGAQHATHALNLMAVWMWPYTDKIDIAFSAGPSILIVNQDIVSAVNILPESAPYASPVIDRVTVTAQRKTTVGINAGVDMSYMVTRRYGVGVGARYVWGSASLEALNESLTVGGFQILGGIRLRFGSDGATPAPTPPVGTR